MASNPPAQQNHFSSIFQNPSFRLLWISQLFGQSAQNAIFFVQMVMVEGLTRSSALVGLMVLVFNLPSIMFGLLTGLVLDRFHKKPILLFCNVSRVFVVAGFIFFRRYAQGGGLLTAVYVLTFILSTISQLSDPAESAMVPLLVPRDQLLTANSVFHMLFNVAQVLGVIVMAPLALKFGGVDGAFATISLAYLVTAGLIWPISTREPAPDPGLTGDVLSHLWDDVRAGWDFVLSRTAVLVAICQHALLTMLTMIIAVLAPGFVTRVLGMQPTDAVYIFFSAGVGMFLTTMWTGQLGHRFRRERLAAAGLVIIGLALAGFTLVALRSDMSGGARGVASMQLITQVTAMALALGVGGTLTVVSAQTIVQERTPVHIRGRVIAAEFLFTNVVGLIPMLLISSLADIVGIPMVLVGLTTLVVVSALLSFRVRGS
jgi:Na+/melibiose symporter-like transporter